MSRRFRNASPSRRGLAAAVARGAIVGALFLATWSMAGGLAPAHSAPSTHAKAATIDDITKHVMCQCGCNLTVQACEAAMACDVAPKMKVQAATYISQGMSVSQALDAFVRDYGERVLAAPTKKGFNLVAWIMPFVGLAAGAGLVTLALLTWRKRRPAIAVAVPVVDSELLDAVEEEIKRDL